MDPVGEDDCATSVVTPANPGSESGAGAGVQSRLKALERLDSGFRRNDIALIPL